MCGYFVCSISNIATPTMSLIKNMCSIVSPSLVFLVISSSCLSATAFTPLTAIYSLCSSDVFSIPITAISTVCSFAFTSKVTFSAIAWGCSSTIWLAWGCNCWSVTSTGAGSIEGILESAILLASCVTKLFD